MELISSNDYINVIEKLCVMKYFMKRREYKRVEEMCMDLILGETQKEIGNVKLRYKPSGIDFAKAVEIVWGFLLKIAKKWDLRIFFSQKNLKENLLDLYRKLMRYMLQRGIRLK